MQIALGLPTHRVDLGTEFVSGDAITELARSAEEMGYGAVYVTDHPFPEAGWLATGGHHALDPFVALTYAAAATTDVRLQTNLIVLAYRNPFLAAKAIATLDALSGGRTIIGIGAGYLSGEFRALGVDPEQRNALTDEAIRAMKAAWSGETVAFEGSDFVAAGNRMLPTPAQRPHPPLLIGGNSARAVRRVVELADGWVPMPTTGLSDAVVSGRLRTAPLDSAAALKDRVTTLRDRWAEAGRAGTPAVAFTPPSLVMAHGADALPPAAALVHEAGELADAGVSQLTIALPGETRRDLLRAMESYAADVIPHLPALT